MSDELDALSAQLDELEKQLAMTPLDPFIYGHARQFIENGRKFVASLRKPPALAPGKHEPEPIILAATQKKPRPRAQKGQ